MPCFLYVLSPLQESARVVHALFSMHTVTVAGISLSVEQWEALKGHVDDIDQAVKKHR